MLAAAIRKNSAARISAVRARVALRILAAPCSRRPIFKRQSSKIRKPPQRSDPITTKNALDQVQHATTDVVTVVEPGPLAVVEKNGLLIVAAAIEGACPAAFRFISPKPIQTFVIVVAVMMSWRSSLFNPVPNVSKTYSSPPTAGQCLAAPPDEML